MWLVSSVVRVLARYTRGPGFESRSGHCKLSPDGLLHWTAAQKSIHKTSLMIQMSLMIYEDERRRSIMYM